MSEPCFDRPNLKATFRVTLIVPKDLSALSNTTIASQHNCESDELLAGSDLSQWQTFQFQETPPMSTYLLAWAIGNFESISSTFCSSDGRLVPISVIASRQSGHIKDGKATLALKALERAMPACEELFGAPYALGKLDMLVCDEFESQAMENCGLITGRAANLLHDAKRDGLREQQKVLTTIYHEV